MRVRGYVEKTCRVTGEGEVHVVASSLPSLRGNKTLPSVSSCSWRKIAVVMEGLPMRWSNEGVLGWGLTVGSGKEKSGVEEALLLRTGVEVERALASQEEV